MHIASLRLIILFYWYILQKVISANPLISSGGAAGEGGGRAYLFQVLLGEDGGLIII